MSITIPLDIARCAGRMDLMPDGEWCDQRDTCRRYLAFTQWDRAAGLPDYRDVSVFMGARECGRKIEAEQ